METGSITSTGDRSPVNTQSSGDLHMDDKTTMTLKLLKQLQDEMMCDAGKRFVPKKVNPEDTEVPADAPSGDMSKEGLEAHLDKVREKDAKDDTDMSDEDVDMLVEADEDEDVGAPMSKASQRMAKRIAARKG